MIPEEGERITLISTKHKFLIEQSWISEKGNRGLLITSPTHKRFLLRSYLEEGDKCKIYHLGDKYVARGAPLVEPIIRDTYIDSKNPDSNYCKAEVLKIGDEDENGIIDKQIFLKIFGLKPSSIKNASKIELKLFVPELRYRALATVFACEQLKWYDNCSITWNNKTEYFNFDNCTHVGNFYPSWSTGIRLSKPPDEVVETVDLSK